MAAQHVPKAQVETSGLMAGETFLFPESARDRALAKLLLIRCSDAGLIGSQVLEQAKLCGQAVKAAFEELGKEVDSKE